MSVSTRWRYRMKDIIRQASSSVFTPRPTIPEDILDEEIKFATVYPEPEDDDDDDDDGDLFRPMMNVVPDPLPPFLPISRLEPPATVSPSEGVLVDCGMMPSLLHPPGQRPSRRQIPSPQGPEQGKVGGGDGQTGVGWVAPFSRDFRPGSAYQQKPGEFPGGVYSIARDSKTHEVSPYISISPSSSSSSSGYDLNSHSSIGPHRVVASSTRPSPPQNDRPFHAHGWVEYLLPDESLYYVHQGYQLVADMDLNNEKLLDGVMAYLQDHCDDMPPGQELWLRESSMGSHEGVFVPLRWLVDHTKQSVVFYPSHETNNSSESHSTQRGCEDDRIDAKYRYWSFMEAHPAHTSLPPAAYQDAMDALHWASTNRLINSHPSCSTAAPFTQEECQGLTALLLSIHQRGETPLRTHTVSKILLRVVCWRQSHFRPDKPLPTDVGRVALYREDHSTPDRSNAFILITAVYACLAAALCLSQTLMRITGIGAILFLLSPVVSNLVAIIQSKVDNGSVVAHARRTISISLKDRNGKDPKPPALPPDTYCCGRA